MSFDTIIFLCPICRQETFNEDYDHYFYVKDNKLVCTGILERDLDGDRGYT